MLPISGVNIGGVQPLAPAEKVLGAAGAQRPEEETYGRQPKPVMDEYVPEAPQEPSGRYWMGRDEDGRPKIYFDDPERTPGAPDAGKPDTGSPETEEPDPASRGSKGPEGKKDKGEVWACNTDKVDREIETLKKKRQELSQRLNTETNEAKIRDLERQLAQVERALKQKDNDTYRKQNATFTQLS